MLLTEVEIIPALPGNVLDLKLIVEHPFVLLDTWCKYLLSHI